VQHASSRSSGRGKVEVSISREKKRREAAAANEREGKKNNIYKSTGQVGYFKTTL
jgi:hypothetical protein